MQSKNCAKLYGNKSASLCTPFTAPTPVLRSSTHLIQPNAKGSRYDNAGFSQPKESTQRVLGSSPPPPSRPASVPEPVASKAVSASTRAVKEELMAVVGRMGMRAILPGSNEEKATVDKLLEQLQQCDPLYHLRSDSSAGAAASGRDSSAFVDNRLFGTWELLYASNGTAVTRTGIAQLMISASSRLPGVGISGIRQTLALAPDGGITTTNEAVFGFGPLGSWAVGIDGAWRNTGDGRSVKVMFDKFKVRPVGVLGLTLPDWLPQVLISLGSDSTPRGGADWFTTYLDDELRVGQGKSGNTFLFRRINSV